MKKLDIILIVLLSICLFLIIIYLSVMPITFNSNFYEFMFNRLKLDKEYNLEMIDLINAKNVMLDYFKGKRPDMDYITASGEHFFVVSELEHMADVKVLFDGGRKIYYGALIISFIISIYLFWRKKFINEKWLKTVKITFISIGFFIAIIIVLGIIQFDMMFEYFHLLFFEGDTWLFPLDSHLIQMLPAQFFFTIVMIIFVKIILYFLLLFLSLYLFGKAFFPKDVSSTKNIIHE